MIKKFVLTKSKNMKTNIYPETYNGTKIMWLKIEIENIEQNNEYNICIHINY